MHMDEAHWQRDARRVGKVFACFANQVRHGLGRWEGRGPFVVRADDDLLQVRPGPDMPLLSLRPHLVTGPDGVECFIHCSETGTPEHPQRGPVAVYRYGISGQVRRHPGDDCGYLGVLSDSYVAVEVVRTLIAEAQARFSRQPHAARLSLAHRASPATREPGP
jgi:hypothetical protein